MSQNLEQIIKMSFAKIQKLPVEEVDVRADLFEVYGMDSLRAVKLLSSLEVELDIELPEEQLGKLRTLGDVVACVSSVVEQGRKEAAR
jgi:acyl carrier protein